MFDMEDLSESVEGFFVNRDIASRITNTLKAESQALSTSIHLLFERRLGVDSLIRYLKSFVPSTSMGEHGLE